MNDDVTEDVNNFIPSLLNPRTFPKANGNILTQNSITSRCSLSLKRNNSFTVKKNLAKVPSYTNNTAVEKELNKENLKQKSHVNATKNVVTEDKINTHPVIINHSQNEVSQRTHNKERILNSNKKEDTLRTVRTKNKEVTPNNKNKVTLKTNINKNESTNTNRNERLRLLKAIDVCSIELSALTDLLDDEDDNNNSSSFNPYFGTHQELNLEEVHDQIPEKHHFSTSLISISSATDLIEKDTDKYGSDSTESYDFNEKLPISVSFGLTNCENFDISTKNSNIKKISISRNNNNNSTIVDCEVVESSSSEVLGKEESAQSDEEMEGNAKDNSPSSPKRLAVALNLQIKNQEDLNKTCLDNTENSKVLILNTTAIDRLSHVIVQPPNYNLVKRQNSDGKKITNSAKKRRISIGQNVQWKTRLKQPTIDSFLVKNSNVKLAVVNGSCSEGLGSDDVVMSKNLVSSAKCDHHKAAIKGRKETESSSPPLIRQTSQRNSPKLSLQPQQRVKSAASSDAQRVQSAGSARRNGDSMQFTLPSKTRSNRTTLPRPIPAFKIVSGTHFAVDAFSYGDIPNVNHYFLTHFHSDHYAGLKKNFNKLLLCSKITAELCVSRLGVNPQCVRVLNCDETINIDNIEITPVDANHCPGALMLVFVLPGGKTLLHTGDFRASPFMESYPVFWNKDIHTIYLDTTYCNPRYDFPTQDQSLEMALYLLRQKKVALEKAGKKFSSVLIICGTYTIGKEKFFLGMSRRVGCSVWACPEKDRVLQAVEGRSFSHTPPQSCQLHVVPMRDLTHEKLSSYLSSLQGAFSEVVAFKPSGWENGKNTSIVQKDAVTIHGIPYSEHSSFSEMIRFVKFLKPKEVVPTVDISGGAKSVQKYFPCPIVSKELGETQSKLSDFFTMRSQAPSAVT